MEGCGPCNAARPEWKKIENILEDKYKDRENYIIVDIDQSLMDGIEGLKDTPNAFPAIRYMKGRNYASYESNRDIDSFIKWIETNMKQSGGKLKRTKRNSRTRKRKQTRKRKYKRQNK